MHFSRGLTKSIQRMVERHRTMMNSDHVCGKSHTSLWRVFLQGVDGKHLTGARTLVSLTYLFVGSAFNVTLA